MNLGDPIPPTGVHQKSLLKLLETGLIQFYNIYFISWVRRS